MKKKLLQITIALFLLLGSIISICLALEVGTENAQIDFFSNEAGVYFVVTDPQGRRAGYDPVTLQYIEEFPASFAVDFGEGMNPDEGFSSGGMMNLIPGSYTIEVIGNGLAKFSMSIRIFRGVPSGGSTDFDFKTLELTPEQITTIKASFTDFRFEGVIDKGLISKFQFTYTSDPSKPAGTATKVVTSSSLKQDITLSGKIGWIDNDGIMNSLLKKVEAVEAAIAKGNKETAKNELNAFINEVNAQKGKHISDKAVKIFLEDAQYMMESL